MAVSRRTLELGEEEKEAGGDRTFRKGAGAVSKGRRKRRRDPSPPPVPGSGVGGFGKARVPGCASKKSLGRVMVLGKMVERVGSPGYGRGGGT